MRQQYTTELQEFYDNLVHLGNTVNEIFHKSMLAYNNFDKVLAQEIIDNDVNINNLVVEVEGEAYRLIALQQPVTDDLRQIFTILLGSTDLERIADHASAIGKNVIRWNGEDKDVVEIRETVNEMAKITQGMLEDVLNAIREQSDQNIQEIAKRDDEVDKLLKKLYKQAAKGMKNNPEIVNFGIGHLNVGKSIERIGDYVTNICERILYLTTGKMHELNN